MCGALGHVPLWANSGHWSKQKDRLAAVYLVQGNRFFLRSFQTESFYHLVLMTAPTSNKIIQKRLASARERSGTVPHSGGAMPFGILLRRLLRRSGASAVAAMVAAEAKEIPMTKTKLKRKTVSRSNNSKVKVRNSAIRTAARETVKLKRVTKSAAAQPPRSSSQNTGRSESKQARIIAMLRAPDGTTIGAMMHATSWQQHSVRGFLAGVIRKKLGLTLVSADGDDGRVYRISDRPASAAA
jgi:hypothetical protein